MVVDDIGMIVRAQLVVGLPRLGRRIDDPVHRELHRRGVERRAVAELDALLQLKRVRLHVGGDRPRLGERRDEVPRVRLPHERLADILRHADRGIEVGDVRVHRAVQIKTEPVEERPALRRSGRGAARSRGPSRRERARRCTGQREEPAPPKPSTGAGNAMCHLFASYARAPAVEEHCAGRPVTRPVYGAKRGFSSTCGPRARVRRVTRATEIESSRPE